MKRLNRRRLFALLVILPFVGVVAKPAPVMAERAFATGGFISGGPKIIGEHTVEFTAWAGHHWRETLESLKARAHTRTAANLYFGQGRERDPSNPDPPPAPWIDDRAMAWEG